MKTCETCKYWTPGNVTMDLNPPVTYGDCAVLDGMADRQGVDGVSVPNFFGCIRHEEDDA
jgi:hypothetical protein